MNLSRFDLMDKISGYSWSHTTKNKQGNEITYDAVAMDDIKQALDEFMNNDDFFVVVEKIQTEEVLECDILERGFEIYKKISDTLKVYSFGDYLLYFNFKLKTMTIYEIIVDFESKKEPILKRAKMPNKLSFHIIMNALNFTV